MDVGTEDGMLWRSKQLFNALKKKNVIVEAILRRRPAGSLSCELREVPKHEGLAWRRDEYRNFAMI